MTKPTGSSHIISVFHSEHRFRHAMVGVLPSPAVQKIFTAVTLNGNGRKISTSLDLSAPAASSLDTEQPPIYDPSSYPSNFQLSSLYKERFPGSQLLCCLI